MKNLIIKIATLASIIFGLSGCAQKKVYNGDPSIYLKNNSKTKVYYKDFSEDLALKATKKLVEDLNGSAGIISLNLFTITNPNEVSSFRDAKYTVAKNDLGKKVEGGKFKLSSDGTKIIFEKQYNNLVSRLEEYQNIANYISFPIISGDIKDFASVVNKRDTYLTTKVHVDQENSDMQELIFFTRYSGLHNLVKNDIKKQIELGGWEMVDSPEKADKEIYFELSRDYDPVELRYLAALKKGIKFSSLESDTNKFKFYENQGYNGDHIVIGQSAMDLASASNGNVVSAVIGLTVAGVFSLLSDKPKKEENKPKKQEVSGSFVSLRVIDKVKKTDNVKIYDTFFDNVKADTKKDLLRKINETINIDPDSKEYNIN
ncbi:hypothetical protein N5U26_10610 [Aliarcobacter cryaerophilus]|uniref:hypothetical protein n=1 Tax=Aliarcobacter cryaerophilus TaxID=28198 RepID=UPI0021B6632D|nr:hypothetical protein [Aliarcobacter cryaerophilus]MCT7510808.1 hypothetical protein [Aliarcobacter cryaerophilus]